MPRDSSQNPSAELQANAACFLLDLPPTLKTLSLHPKATPAQPPDSWEEEALTTTSSPTSSPTSNTQLPSAATEDADSIPSVPPPTPISPTHRTSNAPRSSASQNLNNLEWDNPYGAPTSPTPHTSAAGNVNGTGGSRPEKSTAAAGRMIAAGLGVRQPKKSEENKAYENAIREKERKRREIQRGKEKERVEEMERAKRGVWED
ncbi:MAG: hypothetical protein HETSPECPRED_010186 [Heterodermia speciosa]|uniref:Uncharacterized protein n=1 Tax=Heterodermia speciosa TaxID=116794 RepID=A0A8H3IEL3_9LECA|nr:MAG: hypothetical protein HETSPECPRED_010186 [Heterodermia speciosa]